MTNRFFKNDLQPLKNQSNSPFASAALEILVQYLTSCRALGQLGEVDLHLQAAAGMSFLFFLHKYTKMKWVRICCANHSPTPSKGADTMVLTHWLFLLCIFSNYLLLSCLFRIEIVVVWMGYSKWTGHSRQCPPTPNSSVLHDLADFLFIFSLQQTGEPGFSSVAVTV